MLRLHYIAGTFAQRRASFVVYAPLLLRQSVTLQSFLQPAVSNDQLVDAYYLMVSRIFDTPQPPPEATTFHMSTALSLANHLTGMPEVPTRAASMVPIGDASFRAQEAVAEFSRRRLVVNNSSNGSNTVPSGVDVPASVIAGRTLRQQLMATLLPLPFFGPADADIIRLHGANPANDFPCFKRAIDTRNVVIFQVVSGRLRGVGDAAGSLRILEGAAAAFPKYIEHVTMMDKAPLATAGTRQPHTLTFNNQDFTRTFLSNNREQFMKLNILETSNGIRSHREQSALQPIQKGENLFVSAEHLPIMRSFTHYLEGYGFVTTGAGSWEEAITRLEQLRQSGLSMPGQSLEHHFDNCLKAYDILRGELFDALSHFTQMREAPDVGYMLSNRIYEPNGAFDRHLAFQNKGTSELNALLRLNPAFATALSGGQAASSSGAGSGTTQLTDSSTSGKVKYRWGSGGSLTFGKGNSGPKYETKAIWAEIHKLKPGLNQGNFCIVHYLSTQGACNNLKHGPNCAQHKFSKELKELREAFEHKPFRTDAKAKAAK